MKIAVRDLIEIGALALVIATVATATHLIWASLLAGAVVMGYLAHAWEWEAVLTVPRPKFRRTKRRSRKRK